MICGALYSQALVKQSGIRHTNEIGTIRFSAVKVKGIRYNLQLPCYSKILGWYFHFPQFFGSLKSSVGCCFSHKKAPPTATPHRVLRIYYMYRSTNDWPEIWQSALANWSEWLNGDDCADDCAMLMSPLCVCFTDSQWLNGRIWVHND